MVLKFQIYKKKLFSSKANLYSSISKDGKMNFKVVAPKLNYLAVTDFYLSPFSALISGVADTQVNFIIGKHGLEQLTLRRVILLALN